MKKIGRLFGLAAIVAGVALMAGPAQAAFMDFRVDLNNAPVPVGGLPYNIVTDDVTFSGTTTITVDAFGPGTFSESGTMSLDAFYLNGGIVFGSGLNAVYTGFLDFVGLVGGYAPNMLGGVDLTFAPGSPVDIILDPDGPLALAPYVIASFTTLTGDGIILPGLTNGSIDLILAMTANPYGIFQTLGGVPLPLGYTIALTDMDLDALDWTLFPPIVTAMHNGSVHLQVVPEPTTVLLLGAGLVGLCLWARRKIS